MKRAKQLIHRTNDGRAEKNCSGCKAWKEEAAYNRRGKRLQAICKDCQHAYHAQWRALRRERKQRSKE